VRVKFSRITSYHQPISKQWSPIYEIYPSEELLAESGRWRRLTIWSSASLQRTAALVWGIGKKRKGGNEILRLLTSRPLK
jgi:hypothetical protein